MPPHTFSYVSPLSFLSSVAQSGDDEFAIFSPSQDENSNEFLLNQSSAGTNEQQPKATSADSSSLLDTYTIRDATLLSGVYRSFELSLDENLLNLLDEDVYVKGLQLAKSGAFLFFTRPSVGVELVTTLRGKLTACTNYLEFVLKKSKGGNGNGTVGVSTELLTSYRNIMNILLFMCGVIYEENEVEWYKTNGSKCSMLVSVDPVKKGKKAPVQSVGGSLEVSRTQWESCKIPLLSTFLSVFQHEEFSSLWPFNGVEESIGIFFIDKLLISLEIQENVKNRSGLFSEFLFPVFYSLNAFYGAAAPVYLKFHQKFLGLLMNSYGTEYMNSNVPIVINEFISGGMKYNKEKEKDMDTNAVISRCSVSSFSYEKFFVEFLQEIVKIPSSQLGNDIQLPHNLCGFLSSAASLMPLATYKSIPWLGRLLDNEHYVMRAGLVGVLGTLIQQRKHIYTDMKMQTDTNKQRGHKPNDQDTKQEDQQVEEEEEDSPAPDHEDYAEAVKVGASSPSPSPSLSQLLSTDPLFSSLFSTLTPRIHDVNAHVRSRVYQVFAALIKENFEFLSSANFLPLSTTSFSEKSYKILPFSAYSNIVVLCIDRIMDKSAAVRKFSLQVLSCLIEYNPLGRTLNANLYKNELMGKAKLFEEEMKEMEGNLKEKAEIFMNKWKHEEKTQRGPSPPSESPEEVDESKFTEKQRKIQRDQNSLDFSFLCLKFVESINSAIPSVLSLLTSSILSDLVEASKFFVVANTFELQNSHEGVRKMLKLIWSREQTVRDNIIMCYTDLYIGKEIREMIEDSGENIHSTSIYSTHPHIKKLSLQIGSSLISLVNGVDLCDFLSIEEFLSRARFQGFIPECVIQAIWEIFGARKGVEEHERTGALILLVMIAKADPSILVVGSSFQSLISIGLEGKAEATRGKFALSGIQKLLEYSIEERNTRILTWGGEQQEFHTLTKNNGGKHKGEKEEKTKRKGVRSLECDPAQVPSATVLVSSLVGVVEKFQLLTPQDKLHEIYNKIYSILLDPAIYEEETSTKEIPANFSSYNWYAIAEQAISTLFLLHPDPQEPLKRIIHIMAKSSLKTPQHLKTPTLSPHPNVHPRLGNLCLLSRLFFILGQVAIKILVQLEQNEKLIKKLTNIKRQKFNTVEDTKGQQQDKTGGNKRKNAKTSSSSNSIEEELAVNASEEFELEILREKAERSLISLTNENSSHSLLGSFAPILVEILTNPFRYSHSLLQSSSLLCLTKYMCISSSICTPNLRLVFSLLIGGNGGGLDKTNLLIAIGDLAFRFPNQVEPFSPYLYEGLQDNHDNIKFTSLQVITHLILNDMLKPKGSISEIARLIIDKSQRISSLAKFFFTELAHKGKNPIFYLLPEILSRLSKSLAKGLKEQQFETILSFLLSFVKKDKQAELLVEKLCIRFGEQFKGNEQGDEEEEKKIELIHIKNDNKDNEGSHANTLGQANLVSVKISFIRNTTKLKVEIAPISQKEEKQENSITDSHVLLCRCLSFCLLQLPFNLNSLKKLIDGFKYYSTLLGDNTIYNNLMDIIHKISSPPQHSVKESKKESSEETTNPNEEKESVSSSAASLALMKPETRQMLTEFEQKLQEFHQKLKEEQLAVDKANKTRGKLDNLAGNNTVVDEEPDASELFESSLRQGKRPTVGKLLPPPQMEQKETEKATKPKGKTKRNPKKGNGKGTNRRGKQRKTEESEDEDGGGDDDAEDEGMLQEED